MNKAGARARICVVGSINVDIVVRSERLPKPGETISGTSSAIVLGGKGANQAVAAARLGADVLFIGKVGRDSFGDFARSELARFGIDARGILIADDVETGIAAIGIESTGQNAITIVPGANAALTPADLEPFAADIAACDVLLLQCEVPAEVNIAAARMVRNAGGLVIVDPAPVPPGGIQPELWSLASVMTPNETESALLTGADPHAPDFATRAAAVILERGAAAALVKLGAAGVHYQDATMTLRVPAFPVTVVDTVAAGDCFNAAFGVATAERIGSDSALVFAAAAGAVAVSRAGAAAAAPSREEVEQLVRTAPRRVNL